MKYLASLYSKGCETERKLHQVVRESRYEYAALRLKDLLIDGEIVFSPIVHAHQISVDYGLPKDYTFFQKIDRHMIELSEEVLVLKMEDDFGTWKESVGITDEIQYAKSLGKKITYLECEDYY